MVHSTHSLEAYVKKSKANKHTRGTVINRRAPAEACVTAVSVLASKRHPFGVRTVEQVKVCPASI